MNQKTLENIFKFVFAVVATLVVELCYLMLFMHFFSKPATVIQVTATLHVINPTMPKDRKIDFKTVNINDRVGMEKLEKETGISASTMKALEEASLEEQKK